MQIPQQKNNLLVVGFLKSKYLNHRQFNNQDTITGNIIVSFKDNKGRINNHRINIFAPQYTKNGQSEMPSYKSVSALENFTSIDEYKEAEDKGIDTNKPDRIKVKGSLNYNVYTDKENQIHKNLRLSGSFFSRVNENNQDTVNQANAELEISVTGYQPELMNDEPTGNQIVQNVNVGYNNYINTIPNLKFDMNELGGSIDDIMNYFPAGKTMPIQIKLENAMEEDKTEEKAHGFGKKTQITTATRFINNNLIYYVSTDQPKVILSEAQVNEAKNLLKSKSQPELNNKINSFNNNSSSNTTKSNDSVEISDDDIPF